MNRGYCLHGVKHTRIYIAGQKRGVTPTLRCELFGERRAVTSTTSGARLKQALFEREAILFDQGKRLSIHVVDGGGVM